MTGRLPKPDGRKAQAGAQGLIAQGLTLQEAAGIPFPTTLGRYGRAAWKHALATLAPKQNLASIDLPLLEIVCRYYEVWSTTEREIIRLEAVEKGSGEFSKTPNGHVQMSHLRILSNRMSRDYRYGIQQFGGSPLARISTSGTAQGDLFDFFRVEAPKDDDGPKPIGDPTDPYYGMGGHLQ